MSFICFVSLNIRRNLKNDKNSNILFQKLQFNPTSTNFSDGHWLELDIQIRWLDWQQIYWEMHLQRYASGANLKVGIFNLSWNQCFVVEGVYNRLVGQVHSVCLVECRKELEELWKYLHFVAGVGTSTLHGGNCHKFGGQSLTLAWQQIYSKMHIQKYAFLLFLGERLISDDYYCLFMVDWAFLLYETIKNSCLDAKFFLYFLLHFCWSGIDGPVDTKGICGTKVATKKGRAGREDKVCQENTMMFLITRNVHFFPVKFCFCLDYFSYYMLILFFNFWFFFD